MTRFLPITKGRHGMGPNPAARGLQLTNLGVRDLAIAKGISARAARGNVCAGLAPTMDTWFTYLISIKDAPDSFPDEVLNYCPLTLLKKISNATRLEFDLPDKAPAPVELQAFIDDLCRKYGN